MYLYYFRSHPHEPQASSESFRSVSTDRATLSQFMPPGESRACLFAATICDNRAPSADMGLTGSYLTSALMVQSTDRNSDVWMADNSASCYMTRDAIDIYELRFPLWAEKLKLIRDRTKLRDQWVGNMDVVFRVEKDEHTTIEVISSVPGLDSICSPCMKCSESTS